MAWTAPATTTVGQVVTAAFWNTQIRDNFLETSAATAVAAGDLMYADAGNSMGSRVGIGASGTVLVSNGSAPTWATYTTRVRKTADETITTQTALQNDNHLLWAVGTNEFWMFEFMLYVSGDATGDAKFHVTGPAGVDTSYAYVNYRDANVAFAVPALQDENEIGLVIGISSVQSLVHIVGSMLTAGTAGNAQLQWAQQSATGSLTVHTNSYLVAQKL